jgi:hypothetical protein
LEDINARFNEELQRQIEGALPAGHVYRLGRPQAALLAAGVADLAVELSAERLARKANPKYKSAHPFDIAEVRNLPKAINEPIAVFKSAKVSDDSKIVLTELKDKNGNNFIAVVKLRKGDRKNILDVNTIASVYPKDRAVDVIGWLASGQKAGKNRLTLWLDKEKARGFVLSQPSNVIAGGHKEGSLINIINNF